MRILTGFTEPSLNAEMPFLRWPEGFTCPICGGNKIGTIHEQATLVRRCPQLLEQFTALRSVSGVAWRKTEF